MYGGTPEGDFIMSKTSKLLPDDTIIVKRPKTLNENYLALIKKYKKYFKHVLGDRFNGKVGPVTDFKAWIAAQAGRTIKKAAEEWSYQLEEYTHQSWHNKNMEETLKERRFNIFSDDDKKFILALDKAINELGYDFGGSVDYGYTWISYGKSGTKSRPRIANISINEDGIVLRFYLSKVDKHREYIENAPPHIKEAFIFEGGDCTGCCSNFCSGKIYNINGNSFHKCNHHVFFFKIPTLEKLADYKGLLFEFYPKTK